MKLVVCEKPSVAKAIASALGVTSRADGFYEGNGLIVSQCVGHLVSPLDAAGYDECFKKWRYDDLPILPEPFRYVLAPGKEDVFETLRSLMGRPDVDTVVNACNAGREGELIFRLVYEMAGCKKPILRLWISQMEDTAIREGFSDLRPGTDYEALYQSALCRQKADWLVGINATRLFSVLYHRTLNVGRVQTPTLAMLAERDARIGGFQKEKYHHVRLKADRVEAVSEKIASPEDAQTVRAACDRQSAVCTSVIREQKKEQPPKLYDLTTLQREANRMFGQTAKQTLDYAQGLYEKKLLTYPRTDSRHLKIMLDFPQLLIARESTPLESIIMTSYPYVYASELIEDCIERIRDYSEDSIPVLDENNRLTGVLTAQDIVQLVNDLLGEDYAKLAGLSSGEDLQEPLKKSIGKRLPWLVILLGLGMVVSSVVGLFETVVAHLTLIVCFQSLVLDMAGNVGTQSLSVTIRVLMDEHLSGKQKLFLISKEARVGLLNGLILGVLSFAFIGLYLILLKGQSVLMAFSISACTGVALLVSMLLSSIAGTAIPISLKKMKIDPAVASGPLITTINDLVAVVSYYGLAWILLINILHL